MAVAVVMLAFLTGVSAEQVQAAKRTLPAVPLSTRLGLAAPKPQRMFKIEVKH